MVGTKGLRSFGEAQALYQFDGRNERGRKVRKSATVSDCATRTHLFVLMASYGFNTAMLSVHIFVLSLLGRTNFAS